MVTLTLFINASKIWENAASFDIIESYEDFGLKNCELVV